MTELPECDYRVPTDEPRVFFCRHARVHSAGNRVTPAVCRICAQRTVPCETPRPVPKPGEEPPPPRPPSLFQKAWNVAKATAAFVADGLATVDAAEYHRRLSICDSCKERRGNRCLKCGCRLALKARGRAFACPLGKWKADDDSAATQPECAEQTETA